MRALGSSRMCATILAFVHTAHCISTTSFLDHTKLLTEREDPEWYEANIPFLDVPDDKIQEIYYFRWQSYKGHLVYSGPQYGYFTSEFLTPSSYGAPYGGIVAAAGHHINEGKWLRDQTYGQDLVNYWLAGPGQFSKPQNDEVGTLSKDWAHEYSFWAASSVWQQYLVTGNHDFVVGQLDNLIKQYNGWHSQYNDTLGLYWQTPVWDASEFTASSYGTSKDPYHGGSGYRPTINAYQYGDAKAIAAIATLKGDAATAAVFEKKAAQLKAAMKKHLWDDTLEFYLHKPIDSGKPLFQTREYMGFIPWMFNMPEASDVVALAQLTDKKGFKAAFGPTTTERRSTQWFMHEANQGCCRWDGPSWPFATSQILTAVENVLNNYPEQSHITAADYVSMLQGYAATHYQNGDPHLYQAHDPDEDNWIYRNPDGSDEDYNHSTFVDNVISGLIGVRAQPNASFVINPLAPSSWNYFALENVAYHGHSITILWDRDGTHYKQGRGLRVYVDGDFATAREKLGSLTVNLEATSTPSVNNKVNIAANGQAFEYGTHAFASYSNPGDEATHINDGLIWRTGLRLSSRWTSYRSPNEQDFVGLNFTRIQTVNEVHLYFYKDNDGVALPASYELQFYDDKKRSWHEVPKQKVVTANSTTSNALTKIIFSELVTSKLRVMAQNPGSGKGWGLSEFQVWTPAIFELENKNSAALMGIHDHSDRDGAQVEQTTRDGSLDNLWEFVSTAGGWFKIRNVGSGLLLAGDGSSGAGEAGQAGAALEQSKDNDTDGELWRVVSDEKGYFQIINKKSGLEVGVENDSASSGAKISQVSVSAATDGHYWAIQATAHNSASSLHFSQAFVAVMAYTAALMCMVI